MNFTVKITIGDKPLMSMDVTAEQRSVVLAHADRKGWDDVSITFTATSEPAWEDDLQDMLDTNW